MADAVPRKTIGDWAVIVLAIIIGITGLLMLIGGLWLITLSGSWYYAIAGIGLLATAWFLFRRDMAAVWLYLATFIFTVAWALWERGFNGWAQVPRLVAPVVLLILVLIAIPVLSRRTRARHAHETWHDSAAMGASVGVICLLGAGAVGLATGPAGELLAQEVMHPANDAAQQAQPMTAPAGGATSSVKVADAGSDWPVYGGSMNETRYSTLDEITPENVGKLTQIWEYRTGDMPDKEAEGKYSPETTPIKVGDNLLLCSAKNILLAVDAATGKERWRYDPKVSDDAIPYGATCRGVAYYVVPGAAPHSACATRVVEGTMDARLIEVDAETGQPCADFGTNGEVDLTVGIGYSVPGWYGNVAVPTIVRGVIVMGAQVLDGQAEDAPSGVIRGYDVMSGKLKWAWDMCNPALTGVPPEGQTYTRGTPNMWTSAAGDESLGLVYVPLGNSAVDYYGGNRKDCENEYNSSLVALNADTGKEAWHFQTVHYDLWDYDLGSQPSLVDMPTPDGTVPAVILPSKQGQIYVLDRRTGKSLFPVEERKVPQGTGVEPENLSPTQPYSGYASVDKPELAEADMWGMTPLDQLWCRIQFHLFDYRGQYTPPTLDHYIEYPGYNGGSDWGSVAVDPDRGILVVNYNDMPNDVTLLTREEADERGILPIDVPRPQQAPDTGAQAGSPYADVVNPGWQQSWTGLMCKEPPYGNIRAIDLKTGKTLWDEPLGQARRNGPWGLPSFLPIKIGTPNNGGAAVTKSGLIFIAAATDNLLRAIDSKTGKVLWTTELPAGGQANPMVFEAGGHEYVAIMAGGHHFMKTGVGDYVIAYGLPS